jgi:Flp pilus assembly protein TadD
VTAVPKIATGESAEAHEARARQLIAKETFREAIAELTEAIRMKPDFARAYNARGYAYMRLHDYKAALADFDQAIRIDPKYENAIHNRAAAIRYAR